MNKYQEALNDIKCDAYNFIENNYDDAFKMVYNKQFKLLQELVDQNKPLTLEECIKEWEEKGYKYYKGKNHIHFRYLNECGSYDEYIFLPTELYYVANNTKVTFEMFQLISKTLKALEVEND